MNVSDTGMGLVGLATSLFPAWGHEASVVDTSVILDRSSGVFTTSGTDDFDVIGLRDGHSRYGA